MADFSKALAITLDNEGGFADRSQTTGEVVNRGITLAFLRGIGELTSTGPATPEDIEYVRNLTPEHTTDLYWDYFWHPLSLTAIQDQNISNGVFDLGVNRWIEMPAKWLQQAVCVADDGCIGPKTIAAVNAADPVKTLISVRAAARAFYNVAEPAADRPQWLARLAKMGQLAGLPADA